MLRLILGVSRRTFLPMRILIVIFALLTLAVPAQADDYRYFVSGGFGSLSLGGGDFFSYERENAFGFALGHRLGSQWWFDIVEERLIAPRAGVVFHGGSGPANPSPGR